MVDEPKTLTDFAETQLLNEIRFWAAKYVTLSYVLGANITFFSYHFAFKHMKLYVGIPLTIATFFVSRNLLMKNCMDKIYFPLYPIYQKVRGDEKRKEKIINDA